MSRINAGKVVQQLKTEFKKVAKQERIDIASIPDKKLRSFARNVAGERTVSTGCGTSTTSPKTITPAKLKKAIDQVSTDLKKADKNHDNFLSAAEGRGLSKTAARLLDYTPASPARPARPSAPRVYSGC